MDGTQVTYDLAGPILKYVSRAMKEITVSCVIPFLKTTENTLVDQ